MTAKIRSLTVTFTAAMLLLPAGCENRGDRGGPEPSATPAGKPGEEVSQAAEPQAETGQRGDEIEILCGSSFRFPMEELTKRYENQTGRRAVLVFGGSEDHLPKVKDKIVGDVFVTHSPYQQYTQDAGALLRDVEVGFLAPVLVVPKGNPKGIKRIEDLVKPGLQVLLTDPKYSTCGEMVFALLEKKGIKNEVLQNTGNAMFRQHSEVGNNMKLGYGDAAIMWNGVARNFADAIEVVPAPYEYDDEIRVSIMGLSYTKRKEAVEHFLDFAEANGKEIFAEFGYVK